ncbi:hypothetical protein EDC04DRAFT_2605206 [Pisolithus marmoratus]|nr:hypothetical protein EDC04DRAFT_2605206 [Pisolithus marmoratus]
MSTDPWYPFWSHLNFEFAELALKTALNREQVNQSLRLIKSIHSTREEFTLSKYNDLQSTWEAASHCMTTFKKEVVHVKEVKEHSGKPWFANFKNTVWHKSFRKLLQMVEKESETGCWVKCWDGVTHCFFLVILILSADYEEQAVMALICSIKSNFPCPVCLIPHDHILEFPDQCMLWTSENVLKVLQEAHSQDTTEKKDQILIQQGLHDVDFGDHLWAELLRILDKARCQAMVKVEKNFSKMPHWHTLNHFDKALSISYTDGQKLEDLSKVVVFASLKLHMAHTLVAGQEALSMFNILMKNVARQILDIDHLKAASELIWCRVSNYDAYLSNMQTNVQNSAGSDTDEVKQEDFFHVRLGSSVKEPLLLEAIEQRSMIDKVFM